MIRIIRWCAVSVSVLMIGACLVGCQAVKTASLDETMRVLKDAHFDGSIDIGIEGPPLGLSVTQHYFAGPSLSVHAQGSVHFDDVNTGAVNIQALVGSLVAELNKINAAVTDLQYLQQTGQLPKVGG